DGPERRGWRTTRRRRAASARPSRPPRAGQGRPPTRRPATAATRPPGRDAATRRRPAGGSPDRPVPARAPAAPATPTSSQQITQRLPVPGWDRPEEAGQRGAAIGGAVEHVPHQLGDVLLAARRRPVPVRPARL